MSFYTDEMILFVKKQRENVNYKWSNIVLDFNKKFGTHKTLNAIEKLYKNYKDVNITERAFADNLKKVQRAKESKSEAISENRALVSQMIQWEDVEKSIRTIVKEIDFKMHKPIKLQKAGPISRTNVAHFSDTHFGINILKEEMGGINEYNNVIAARRSALFFKEVAEYKIQHRKNTDLVLVLNGDLVAGVIHNQEHVVDLMTRQFSLILSIIGQGISYLAQHYSKITVICNSGNHDRFQHKADKGRAVANKWDGFASLIFTALMREFKHRYPSVTFVRPLTPYCVHNIQGHPFFMTHGDTVFNVGMPGKKIDMGSFAAQVNKINISEIAEKYGKIKVVLVAHVHTSSYTMLDDGTFVLTNNSLSGLDPFAQSLGIHSSHPSQQVLESTKDHPVGDFRNIQLKSADNNKELDKIIEPFMDII